MNPSTGKTFIVTGGTQGIGKATVLRLIKLGHRVFTCSRHAKDLTALESECAQFNSGSLLTRVLDLSDLEATKTTFAEMLENEDGLDGLVCNAAYQALGHPMELAEADIDLSYRLNILSPMLTMQACYPALKQRHGSIVYVGSVADTRYQSGCSLYGATKAFMNSFVKHASLDTGPDGVRINVVTPGATATPMMNTAMEKLGNTDFIEEIGLRRMAEPDEVAEAILFALEKGTYLNGSDVRIHGGIF